MESHVLETVSKAFMPMEARSPETIECLEDDEGVSLQFTKFRACNDGNLFLSFYLKVCIEWWWHEPWSGPGWPGHIVWSWSGLAQLGLLHLQVLWGCWPILRSLPNWQVLSERPWSCGLQEWTVPLPVAWFLPSRAWSCQLWSSPWGPDWPMLGPTQRQSCWVLVYHVGSWSQWSWRSGRSWWSQLWSWRKGSLLQTWRSWWLLLPLRWSGWYYGCLPMKLHFNHRIIDPNQKISAG